MTVSGGCNKFHDEFKYEENHHVQSFCFETQAEREAATQIEICPGLWRDLNECDLGKVAYQKNINPADGNPTFWVLCGLDPISWDEITNKTVPADTDVKVKVSVNDTTAGFLIEKLTSGNGTNTSLPIELKEINDAGDEDLKIQFDPAKLDHNDLTNSGGPEHIDWTVSGAGTIHPDNYIDNDEKVKVSADETGGSKYLEDQIVAGANITINVLNPGANEKLEIEALGVLTSTCPAVQVRRSTSLSFTGSYSDVTFNLTDIENDASILEHDNTNTDRVLIKETGLYNFHYHTQTDVNSQGIFNYRVRLNDSTVIPGSMSFLEDGGDTFPNGVSFLCECTAGDYVSLQIQLSGGSGVMEPDIIMTVVKCGGAKGDKGDTGSGSTISLAEGGTPVTNTPHDTVDFDNNDFDVVDNGDGSATVSLAANAVVFGAEYAEAESLGESSTGSTSYQNKLTLNVTGIVAGRYRIGFSYRWRHTSTGGDFQARVLENGSTEIFLHQQEPQDTGSDQAFRICSFVNRTLTAGNHTFLIQWAQQNGGTAYISEARFEFWRVS